VSELLAVGVAESDYVLSESEVIWELREAYSVSVQLAVVKALRYYYLMYRRGVRPRDLLLFLKRCGVEVKDNVLRSALSKLVKKGVALRLGHRYYVRMDLKPEAAVMIRRRVHSGSSSESRNRSREFMYARSEDELKDFGMRIAKKIEKMVKEGEREKVLGYILFYGCGLRPSSDRPLGIGLDGERNIYVVVWEDKLKKLRVVRSDEGFFKVLASHQSIFNFLVDVIEASDDDMVVVFNLGGLSIESSVLAKYLKTLLGVKVKWLWLNDNVWRLLPPLVHWKRLARAVFLSYADDFDMQVKVLGEVNGLPVVKGMHTNTGVRRYYVRE